MTTRKEIASNLVIILFGAVFLAYTTRYPLDTWESPGPAVFPLILGVALTILAVGQLFRIIWKSTRKEHREKHSQHHRESKSPAKESLLRNVGDGKALRMVALFILYLLSLQWIGFFVSTFLFGAMTSRLTETKGWAIPVLLSATLTFCCYLLFELWLKLSFPRGILF